ncbi:MAG: tripartite tricarboxylate transporter substrate binding protein, partial [Burkholderiaceae bacterium]
MQMLNRRTFIAGAIVASAAIALPYKAAMAQLTGEQSTMRLIVPFSAAGPTDFIARLFAQALSDELKTTVVV